MGKEQKLALALEYGMQMLPDAIRVVETGGKTIFEYDSKRVCYLEKRLVYCVDLSNIEPTIEAIGKRLVEAVDDFNAKTGSALVHGS
jgi:hypothetical protein